MYLIMHLNVYVNVLTRSIFFSVIHTRSVPPRPPTQYAVTHLYSLLSPIEGGE